MRIQRHINMGNEAGSSSESSPLVPKKNVDLDLEAGSTPAVFTSSKSSNGCSIDWTTFDSRLSNDATALESMIRGKFYSPDHFRLRIRGSYSKDESSERHFEFDISLMGLLPYETQLFIVKNETNVYRGARCQQALQDFGLGNSNTIAFWCARYTTDEATVKRFVVERQIARFDTTKLRGRISQLIRDTGYKGQIDFKFCLKNKTVILSPCRINFLRTTKFIKWFFYLTFLWIFSWPFLWLVTSTHKTITIKYPAVKNEEQFFEKFEESIERAVKERMFGVIDKRYRLETRRIAETSS